MNWSEFFAMGGYAVYIWSCYGLAVVILLINLLVPLRRHARALDRARRNWRDTP
jgi:heme exporter protein D